MSILKIRAALETQLATVLPAIATAWENMPFVPVSGVPYQRVYLLPSETANPTFGDQFKREAGIFQVTVCYPSLPITGNLQGSRPADTQVEAIRAAFTRGSSFTNNGVTVQIDRHPTVSPANIEDDRYCVPVRIRYYANI